MRVWLRRVEHHKLSLEDYLDWLVSVDRQARLSYYTQFQSELKLCLIRLLNRNSHVLDGELGYSTHQIVFLYLAEITRAAKLKILTIFLELRQKSD